ncbi:MAG: hypothetical protein KDC44_15685 [Phaeodactylibacter sp.]|nr:hypothetical protein [Phaeodactylibacter sp.]
MVLPTYMIRVAGLLGLGLLLSVSCKKETDFPPPDKEPVYEFYVEGKLESADPDSAFNFRVGKDRYIASSIIGFDKTFSFLYGGISQVESKNLRLGNTEPFPVYGMGFKLNFGAPGFVEEEYLSKEELEELLQPGNYEIGNVASGIQLFLDLSTLDFSRPSSVTEHVGLRATTYGIEKAGQFEVQKITDYSWQPEPDLTIYGKKVEVLFDCVMRIVDEEQPRHISIQDGHGVFFIRYKE